MAKGNQNPVVADWKKLNEFAMAFSEECWRSLGDKTRAAGMSQREAIAVVEILVVNFAHSAKQCFPSDRQDGFIEHLVEAMRNAKREAA